MLGWNKRQTQAAHTGSFLSADLAALVSEFRALPAGTAVPAGCAEILSHYASDQPRPDRFRRLQDAHVLELGLINLLPLPALRVRQWSLEHTYRSFIGNKTFADYQARQGVTGLGGEAAITEPTLENLRAYLQDLINGKHWLYLNEALRSDFLDRQQRWVAACLGGLGLLLGTLAVAGAWLAGGRLTGLLETWGPALFLLSIGTAGFAGACLSLLQRIKKAQATATVDRSPSTDWSDLTQGGNANLRVSLLSGVSYALVVYGLALGASKLLNLDLMPVFGGSPDGAGITACGGGAFADFLPANGRELAKLYLYALLAGFGERLVPDILDKLTQATPAQNP